MNFPLEVVSITGEIFSGEVSEVTLPGVVGELTALARHMPVVVPLTTGEVILKANGKILNYSIGKGVFSYDGKIGRLLIEDVTAADEISEERAMNAKKRAEDLLAKGIKGEEKIQAQYLLRRSLIDLKIVRRKRRII